MNLKLFSLLGSLAFGFLMLASCEQEALTPGGPDGRVAPRSHDCMTSCIDPDAPVYFYESGEVSEVAGMNYRTFSYTIHNTLDGFVLEWTYSASSPTPRRLHFSVGYDSHTTGCVTTGASGSHTFNLPGGWSACTVINFSASILDCDNPTPKATTSGTYALVGACGCEDELTASVTCSTNTCNRSVTFTYKANEAGAVIIQGGLTAHTTICSATATGGLQRNEDHPSVTNSNANVTRWEGTVDACGEYTITIEWQSTNADEYITGNWTVKDANDQLLASLAPLSCPD